MTVRTDTLTVCRRRHNPSCRSKGATTREIATRAGVTQPLLNYHFSSKDELWQAAVDGLFAELNQALTARAEGCAASTS